MPASEWLDELRRADRRRHPGDRRRHRLRGLGRVTARAGTPYTTAELSLTFLAPARPGGVLKAHGQAIRVGRTVGLSEVFVLDQGGETMIAHGTSRLSIMPPLDDLPEPPDSPEPYPAPEHERPDPYLREPPSGTCCRRRCGRSCPAARSSSASSRGELPAPAIHHLTGIELTAAGDGTAEMRMPASAWLESPARRLQGGTIAMLADATMQIAVLTTAPAGTAVAGLDLKVNFLRPVSGDGADLVARAEVEHSGRTLAIARGRVENAEGKPVMLATGSAMYLPGRAADLSGSRDRRDQRRKTRQ